MPRVEKFYYLQICYGYPLYMLYFFFYKIKKGKWTKCSTQEIGKRTKEMKEYHDDDNKINETQAQQQKQQMIEKSA